MYEFISLNPPIYTQDKNVGLINQASTRDKLNTYTG